MCSISYTFFLSHRMLGLLQLPWLWVLFCLITCCVVFVFSVSSLIVDRMIPPFFCAPIVQIRLYYQVIFSTCSFISVMVMVNLCTFIAPLSQVSTIPIQLPAFIIIHCLTRLTVSTFVLDYTPHRRGNQLKFMYLLTACVQWGRLDHNTHLWTVS